MRMNLKNSLKRKKRINFKSIKLNSRNLFIFLISFSIISILIGILFYFIMSSTDKNTVNNVVEETFKIRDDYNYLLLLKKSILSNTFNTFLIWILGISVVGIVFNIFIYFCELFSVGFTLASIFSTYNAKGVIGALAYLFPSKVIYLIVMFILTYFSIKFSYKLISVLFMKSDINLKKEMHKYFKVLLFSWIIIIGVSMLNVFVDPVLIKLFTNI